MPTGKTLMTKLPGNEALTWVDSMRSGFVNDEKVVDPTTGAVVNPREEFLRERIQFRKNEAFAEQQAAEAAMRKKLQEGG